MKLKSMICTLPPAGVETLRGISLTIESGEQVAIVGQNGAGKTTLVKHFNGLLQPTRGQVLIGDWDTTKHSVAKLASRVGYVFQNPDEQLFSRNVGAEVAFGPKNLGFEAERVEALVNDALALTQLSDKTETNPYDLSATWRKMVALASIISMDTDIHLRWNHHRAGRGQCGTYCWRDCRTTKARQDRDHDHTRYRFLRGKLRAGDRHVAGANPAGWQR
jgi:energy-coupling factor transporter ATP-binding protein EcfA2